MRQSTLLKIKYSFFATKCLRKFYEFALRAFSAIKLGQTDDPTYLLASCLTPKQIQAYQALRNEIETTPAADSNALLSCSIIVPFRDKWPLTQACLNSLLAQDLSGLNLQVVLVDNGSQDTEVAQGLLQVTQEKRILWQTVKIDRPFNYSELNNVGFERTCDFKPDLVLFLNNDIEFTNPQDLRSLLYFKWKNRKITGAVGATLLYPDRHVQHLFLAPGVKIAAAHPLKGINYNPNHFWYQAPRPVAAVTGALLCLTPREFADLKGFDEQLATGYQDLDLCLKLQELGRSNWVVPSVVCIHHENATRSRSHNWKEIDLVYARWGKTLTQNAYLSDLLSRESEYPALRLTAFQSSREKMFAKILLEQSRPKKENEL